MWEEHRRFSPRNEFILEKFKLLSIAGLDIKPTRKIALKEIGVI